MSSAPDQLDPVALQKLTQRLQSKSEKLAEHHLPIDEIKSKMKLHLWERFLLYLAKTDIYAISLCPNSAVMSQAAIGGIVLMVMISATWSSGYTIWTMLLPGVGQWDWQGPGWDLLGFALKAFVVLALALWYAILIMQIDREIVSATNTNWKHAMARVVLAFFMGFTVAYPVKLLFFKAEIQSKIADAAEKSRAVVATLAQIEDAKKTHSIANEDAAKSIRSIEEVLKMHSDETDRERLRGRYGDRAAASEARLKSAQRSRDELVQSRARLWASNEAELKQLYTALEAARKRAIEQNQGILSKMVALDRVSDDVGFFNYWAITGFVILFFMLLEMFPVFIKMSQGHNEYTMYMAARQNLNLQKIVSISNIYMHALQSKSPAMLAEVPLEITDLIAKHIEDEMAFEKRSRVNFEFTPEDRAAADLEPAQEPLAQAGAQVPAATGIRIVRDGGVEVEDQGMPGSDRA